jgi:uncharacterized protein
MQFAWDPRKAAANVRKHRVAFEDATAVFCDANASIFPDQEQSQAEEREIIIGYDASARLLVVSFTLRRDTVRLISARRATPHEIKRHETYAKKS